MFRLKAIAHRGATANAATPATSIAEVATVAAALRSDPVEAVAELAPLAVAPDSMVPQLSSRQQAARNAVLEILASNPGVQRAFVNRFEAGSLVFTLALSGVGTCELLIPSERLNPERLCDYSALLDCLNGASTSAQDAT